MSQELVFLGVYLQEKKRTVAILQMLIYFVPFRGDGPPIGSRARQSRFALERMEAMKLACTETGCWYCLVPWKLRWPAPRVVHADWSVMKQWSLLAPKAGFDS